MNPMKTLKVVRRKGNDLFLGKFSDWVVENGVFRCVGVERPWVDKDKNGIRDPNVSCIKPGEYIIKWTRSPKFKKFTYEVMNVEGAAGIRIHSANWAWQLEGCLAPGAKVIPVFNEADKTSRLGVTSSGTTLIKLEDVLGRVDARLVIIDNFQSYE